MPLQDEPLKDDGLNNKAQEESKKVVSESEYAKQQKEIEDLKKLVQNLASQSSTVQNTGNSTAEIIQAVVGELKKKSDAEKYGEDGSKYIDEVEQDLDDVLEEGVPFYSHSGGYVIVDDKRNGRKVATPFRQPMIFNHFQTTITGSGKDLKRETISRYVSHSKKEVEWLRSSSFYNSKIFEDVTAAKSIHGKLAYHISKVLTSARTMAREQLYAACKAHGIQMSTDLESMRLQYAQIEAQKLLAVEEQAALKSLKESKLEEAMLEDKTTIF